MQIVAVNIKGNDYRVIVSVAYLLGAVYIQFFGVHKTCDRIKAQTVELMQ